jgi:hypothetical protein
MASVKRVFQQETLPTPEGRLAVEGGQFQCEIIGGTSARQTF